MECVCVGGTFCLNLLCTSTVFGDAGSHKGRVRVPGSTKIEISSPFCQYRAYCPFLVLGVAVCRNEQRSKLAFEEEH